MILLVVFQLNGGGAGSGFGGATGDGCDPDVPRGPIGPAGFTCSGSNVTCIFTAAKSQFCATVRTTKDISPGKMGAVHVPRPLAAPALSVPAPSNWIQCSPPKNWAV